MQIKINQVSVMLSLMYQANHRSSNYWLRKETNIFSVLFSLFMICGRLLCGVHWCTDIIGGVLLSFGLFGIYRGAALLCCRNQ
ncbi:phosphatase PAP2 family protein [Ruminococcus sp. AM42-11]|nr:phosphatase PAP2 family protein [Ruminococcus sp. AM42-11]